LKTLKNLLDQCHIELKEIKQDLSKLRPPDSVEDKDERPKRPLLTIFGKKLQDGIKKSRFDNPVKRVQYALTEKDLDMMIRRIDRHKNTLKTQLFILERHEKDVEEWKKLLKWLYADSVSATHSEIRETRAKESGKWLLDDPEFKKWKRGDSEKQLLICTGKGAFLPVQTDY
jgi:hypothetical protein